MKNMFKNRIFLAIPLLLLLLSVGCNSGKKKSPVLVDEVSQDAAMDASLTMIYHLYPSPAEMLDVLDMASFSYDPGLLLSISKKDQFFDTKSRSEALGIYVTDLAYVALFGRHSETLDYLEAVKLLSEELDIMEAVDGAMIEKAKSNVEHLDSLYSLSNEAYINILSYCDRNERADAVVLISAGAFIESLFLATQLVDDYTTADKILQHLADQKLSIANFMRFATSLNSEDPGVQASIEDLKRVQELYEGIELGSKSEVKAEEGAEGKPKKLVIGAAAEEPGGMTEAQFLALKSLVLELRTKMVEGES